MNEDLASSKPHYHVTAGIIRLDGKVLITRRPKGSHLEGFWEFPGGKQEPLESLSQCLVREIREELGLDIEPGREILVVQHEYEEKKITLHFFQCRLVSGQPKPLEGQEMAWIRPDELAPCRFPPPDRKIIEQLQIREEIIDD